jgi:hypothetical protein
MGAAKLVQLLVDRGRIRLELAQHRLLGGGHVHPVGLDGKVVVVAHDKSHRAKRLLANLTTLAESAVPVSPHGLPIACGL